MAKKSKKRELSPEIRQSVIILRAEGYKLTQIAKKLKISLGGVQKTLTRHKETGSNASRPRSGRPKATSPSEDKHLRVSSLRDRCLTVPQLTEQLNSNRTKSVSNSTVRRRLSSAGIHGRISARKPLLRPQNIKKRLQWAREHLHWTGEQWNSVLWSDESKFELFGSKRRKYVRRRKGERNHPQCTTPTVKHGGGSVMVWGCFAADKVGDLHKVQGILNQHGYHSILQRHALPSGRRLVGANFVLQQDNDPKHTSKLCKAYLAKKEDAGVLSVMTWPAQSPDLNPIELLWDELDRRVRAMRPVNVNQLWEYLNQAWNDIPASCCQKLVARMPRLCRAVIKAKGRYFEENRV